MASFFFLTFYSLSAFSNGFDHLDEQDIKRWQALLHYYDGKLRIDDPEFILSLSDIRAGSGFSPKQEWKATARLFRQDPTAICRFPARYRFMTHISQSQSFADVDLIRLCPDYANYVNKVPFDQVSVIYASENLSNPSSMMGHSMLAVERMRQDGYLARHSISFFVDISSFNPFKAAWETLVVGKPGYFLLTPLKSHYEFYNLWEQRNIWRYTLSLSEDDRALLRDHIWELKYPSIYYFFHSHNCATLTLDILRIVQPELSSTGWVTPIDVVKAIDQQEMIAGVDVEPSAKWKIRFLKEIMPKLSYNEVLNWLTSTTGGGLTEKEGSEGLLRNELAYTGLRYLTETKKISPEIYHQRVKEIPEQSSDKVYHVGIGDFRSPTLMPADSQLNIALLNQDGRSKTLLEWLPASHTIEDHNAHYYNDSELKLGGITLQLDNESGELSLRQFDLYSVISLAPENEISSDLSGKFRLGYYPLFDRTLSEQGAIQVEGGVGKTYAVGADLRWFAMLNLGYRNFGDYDKFYLKPELGAYLYEVYDMKTRLVYSPDKSEDSDWQHNIELSHTLLFDHHALMFSVKNSRIGKDSTTNMMLTWKTYY